jgi:hypothetical protein
VSAETAGGGCPLDLNYPEPRPARLEMAEIISRGKLVRRRRAGTRAAGALAACAAVLFTVVATNGSPLTWLRAHTSSVAGQHRTPIDGFVAVHPPFNGELTTVSNWPPRWSTVAWSTVDGSLCWSAYRMPMRGGSLDEECPGWSADQVRAEQQAGLSPVLPGIAPTENGYTTARRSGAGDLVPWFGLVNPEATRVLLTFFGRPFTAKVVPVPTPRGDVGAFLVWLQLPRDVRDYTGANITAETAYDGAGHVVARHGPWS